MANLPIKASWRQLNMKNSILQKSMTFALALFLLISFGWESFELTIRDLIIKVHKSGEVAWVTWIMD